MTFHVAERSVSEDEELDSVVVEPLSAAETDGVVAATLLNVSGPEQSSVAGVP